MGWYQRRVHGHFCPQAKIKNRDRYEQRVVQSQKKLGLRMGKALEKIDFLRFFNEKLNNFRTKLDMDLHFFFKSCVKIRSNYLNLKKKKKKKKKNTQKKKKKKKKKS